jgi:hypothetical protein
MGIPAIFCQGGVQSQLLYKTGDKFHILQLSSERLNDWTMATQPVIRSRDSNPEMPVRSFQHPTFPHSLTDVCVSTLQTSLAICCPWVAGVISEWVTHWGSQESERSEKDSTSRHKVCSHQHKVPSLGYWRKCFRTADRRIHSLSHS